MSYCKPDLLDLALAGHGISKPLNIKQCSLIAKASILFFQFSELQIKSFH